MPKSKRDKKISLTKTSKKGLVLKQHIIDDIRSSVEKYKSIYVFVVRNMRNNKLKDLRIKWKDSRFFFGKIKIMALGLGKTPETETETDLHKLAATLQGECGLLFTDKSEKRVVKWFAGYSEEDYARSGFRATRDVTLKEGTVVEQSHSMEPYLRKLGLPTSLNKGKIVLLKDHEVCKKGAQLTPEQAKILELFEHKMAKFKVVLKGVWTKGVGFKRFETDADEEVEKMETSGEEDED